MHPYPLSVLVLGGMSACIGLEILGLYAYTRQRLYAWLGLLGTLVGIYCYFSFRLYSASSLALGRPWQFSQLVTISVMVDVAILLGLEYFGELRRRHWLALIGLTVLTAGPMLVPGFGLTDQPAVKVIPWLGISYFEAELGAFPLVFFVMAAMWMGYIALKLVRRAFRGSRRDRTMAAAYLFWWLAAINDMLISLDLYRSIYLMEFAFCVVVVGVALVLLGAQHRRGQMAERERSVLARELLVKDRDLARAQAELLEAAKLVAVGQLAAGIAHEVNNPLTYVMANLQQLEAQETSPAKLGLVREALEGSERIRRVVRQLASFCRGTPGARSGRVGPAAEAAIKMAMVKLKDRANVQTRIPELPRVRMDEAELAQVILNLLVNAAQAIEAGHRDENRILVEARARDDRVEIIVEDTGCGIPAEVLPHIFEPFYTTKTVGEGQGLGLAISWELVHKADGHLTAENVRPHGARFVVSLPCRPEARAAADGERRSVAAEKAPDPWEVRRLSVLIVDDERELANALKRALQSCFDVQVAHTGREALQLLAAEKVYDIVLCDLMMPDGSGADVIRGVTECCPALLDRLILMTGATLDDSQEYFHAERSFPLLPKPFRLADFQRVVRELWSNGDATAPTTD